MMEKRNSKSERIRWSGGNDGQCPYVMIGGDKYYIMDFPSDDGKYRYALMKKSKEEEFDYVFRKTKENKSKTLDFAVRVFERWYYIKFSKRPIGHYDGRIYCRKYEERRWIFWVFIPEGEEFAHIVCRTQGNFVDGFYETINSCKRGVEETIRKLQEEAKQQVTFDF